MTTRAYLADGTTFDIDENTEGTFTHMNDVPVLRWAWIGPTPPAAPPGLEGESHADKKARLEAELAALGGEGG